MIGSSLSSALYSVSACVMHKVELDKKIPFFFTAVFDCVTFKACTSLSGKVFTVDEQDYAPC